MTKWRLPDKDELDMRKIRLKKALLGSGSKRGVLISAFIYTLLISIAFIYMYPVLYMFSRSLMDKRDLLDASAKWIPSQVTTQNYTSAFAALDYWNTLWKNIYLAFVPTICQVFVCSMVGYGFARYEFPLKRLWLCVLVLSFLLPSQATSMPNYLLFSRLNLSDGSIKPFLITALLGQGFKSVLCILIFYNFHRQIPHALIEAAQIDGADHFSAYFRIAVPLSAAAIVVVAIFSVVWYWNETYLVEVYLGYNNSRKTDLTTLMKELVEFEASFEEVFDANREGISSTNRLNDAIRMAGTMLCITPLMIFYFFLQKLFTESVDRAGITGE